MTTLNVANIQLQPTPIGQNQFYYRSLNSLNNFVIMVDALLNCVPVYLRTTQPTRASAKITIRFVIRPKCKSPSPNRLFIVSTAIIVHSLHNVPQGSVSISKERITLLRLLICS